MILVLYLILQNIAAFILFGLDKKKAENGRWRISEAFLITVAVLGGAFGALIGMYIFHHKTKKKKFTRTIPILLILWIILLGICLYQNYHIVVTHYEYVARGEQSDGEDSGEESAKEDFTIVQVSDLHNQFFGFDQKYLMNKIREAEPDIIVVTGDVVDSIHTCYTFAKTFFKEAVKIAPTYYITGNHEQRLDEKDMEEFVRDIEDMGVCYLDNKAVQLDGIVLAGVSEDSLGSKLDESVFEIKEAEMGNESERFQDDVRVLLAHEPAYLSSYTDTGADIVLTGHMHGGQVIIPGLGGVFSPDFSFFPELYEGEHTSGDTTMYISRGLGNSVLPVRINNYPELVVLTIIR